MSFPFFLSSDITASAGVGCLRASSGVKVSIGLPPSNASSSNTACMSASALKAVPVLAIAPGSADRACVAKSVAPKDKPQATATSKRDYFRVAALAWGTFRDELVFMVSLSVEFGSEPKDK